MNVSLTPELEKFVTNEVDSGLYQTASEVVRAGLRRLKKERETRLPATLDELKRSWCRQLARWMLAGV